MYVLRIHIERDRGAAVRKEHAFTVVKAGAKHQPERLLLSRRRHLDIEGMPRSTAGRLDRQFVLAHFCLRGRHELEDGGHRI